MHAHVRDAPLQVGVLKGLSKEYFQIELEIELVQSRCKDTSDHEVRTIVCTSVRLYGMGDHRCRPNKIARAEPGADLSMFTWLPPHTSLTCTPGVVHAPLLPISTCTQVVV